MADPIRCPRCGCRILVSGNTELDATPNPRGCWALDATGKPVVAVTFKGGKVTGRAEGFATAVLYDAHFKTCALESAKRAQGIGPKKAAGAS